MIGRARACGVDSGRSVGEVVSEMLTFLFRLKLSVVSTLAMRARRRERIRNLNLSNSVWTITSLKLAEGSAVAFMVSMTSIFKSP